MLLFGGFLLRHRRIRQFFRFLFLLRRACFRESQKNCNKSQNW